MKKINLVYHTPMQLGSGYFGSEGLKRALENNGLLDYGYNQNGGDFLDEERLKSSPIFFVRGFLYGRMPIVARAGNQFKACWQSESYYTRHGDKDSSTQAAEDNQNHFNMMFTCADTDLDMYKIPTYFLPSWIDTTVIRECGRPEIHGLGFIGGREGREDFLDQDKTGIINIKRTKLSGNATNTVDALAQLISKFEMLVSPPGRCFNGMCGRAWEIMGCNRLCFQWLNEETMFRSSKFFKDGEDIVYFKTFDELVEKYKYYLAHSSESRRIAANGCHKVRTYHNENVRVKYIIDCMTIEHNKWLEDQKKIPSWMNEIYAGI